MKKVILLIVLSNLVGCAGLEHNRIAAEQARQQAELGIPEYGVNNRNHPLTDALHGAAWWIGADKVNEGLNKVLNK